MSYSNNKKVMEIIQEDIFIVEQFRITEYQLMKNGQVKDTFFKIRDEHGKVHGRSFDKVQDALLKLLALLKSLQEESNSI